jgi:hypothetical protein
MPEKYSIEEAETFEIRNILFNLHRTAWFSDSWALYVSNCI